MRNLSYKQYFFSIALFLLVTIAALCSWDTLSELFNFPLAQYKHMLAVFILPLIIKFVMSSSYQSKNRVFGGDYNDSNH